MHEHEQELSARAAHRRKESAMSEWTSARARLAVATRYSAPEDEIADLKRAVKTARLAEVIERANTEWPPLDDEQRERLAALLVR